MAVDFSGSFGERAREHLTTRSLVWLTSVGRSGRPNPNPVWFLWHDYVVLVLSQTTAARLRTFAANPQVALSFETSGDGNDVVVFNGLATVRPGLESMSAQERAAYVEKYGELIGRLDQTPDGMFASYPVVTQIELTALRGW